MKKNLPTPDKLNLCQLQQRFPDPESAREYLEALRWENGPVCPHCANKSPIWKIEPNKEKRVRNGLYQCGKCHKQFTVTIGTIFEKTQIPLHKWLIAFYLLNSSKKGISALQIQRMLGLGSYRTAHFMMHRIRHTLKAVHSDKMSGVVEVDETYVGGKERRDCWDGTTGFSNKAPVLSLVERGGKKRSFVLPAVTSVNLRKAVEENVENGSTIITDQSPKYKKLNKNFTHHRVNHGKWEFARRVSYTLVAHSNTVESSFSLLKRGVYGTFHNISKQHLHLYLAEFDHRWNLRKVTDGERMFEALKQIEGKRLTYRKPKNFDCASLLPRGKEKPVR